MTTQVRPGASTVLRLVVVTIAALGLIAGSLAWHAATVRSGSGQEQVLPGFRLVEAKGDSERAIVIDHRSVIGVLDLPTGQFEENPVAGLHSLSLGRGEVAAITQRFQSSVTALPSTGGPLWQFEPAQAAHIVEPVAAFADGAVVVEWCADEADSGAEDAACHWEAFETDGSTRWVVDSPGVEPRSDAYRTGGDFELDSRPFLLPGVAVSSAPKGDQHQWSLLDPQTGERQELAIGTAAVSGPDYVAIQTGEPETGCSMQVFDLTGSAMHQTEWNCGSLDWIWGNESLLVVRPVGGGEQIVVDIATGVVVPESTDLGVVDQRHVTSAGVLVRAEGQWYVSGVADGETYRNPLPEGHFPARYSDGTIVTMARVSSLNPLVSADLRELAVIDPVTGEICASKTLPHGSASLHASALPGCTAVVWDSGADHTIVLSR